MFTPTVLRSWLRPPRAVLTLFFALMTCCAAALFWLGWQLLAQEREVEKQRHREQLESAAENVAANLQLVLARGEVRVQVAPSSTTVTPAGGVPFVPLLDAPEVVMDKRITAAEALEFSQLGAREAVDAYSRLSQSADPLVRVEAMVRAARVLRRQRLWTEALRVYSQLESAGQTAVAGMPAALVARGGACSVLAERGENGPLRKQARLLWQDLLAGRWAVNRQTLDTYLAQIREWVPDILQPDGWEERLRMAEALEQVWEDRGESSGSRFIIVKGALVSVSWESREGTWGALLTGPSQWSKAFADWERRFGLALQLTQLDGTVLYESGSIDRTARLSAHLPMTASGLPVNLMVFNSSAVPLAGISLPNRRRFFLAVFLVFAILMSLGAFFIARAINRELAVARLQTDFVSAVSHEFRTPLTSIRQLTELLATGRMKEQGQVQTAYDLMMSESDRLKRLVEAILDFGRMRSGTYQFRFETVAAGDWTREVLDEYRKTISQEKALLDFVDQSRCSAFAADPEALRNALWNLLDNSVKYSM